MTPDHAREAAEAYADDFSSPERLAALALDRLAWRARRGRKTCATCHEDKPVAAFGRDASRRDGLEVRCRDCRRVNARSATT